MLSSLRLPVHKPREDIQSRNFVIWGPGANIHYGAPFFNTKRSTGLLFTVQESLRFFGVFRIDILQHL